MGQSKEHAIWFLRFCPSSLFMFFFPLTLPRVVGTLLHITCLEGLRKQEARRANAFPITGSVLANPTCRERRYQDKAQPASCSRSGRRSPLDNDQEPSNQAKAT